MRTIVLNRLNFSFIILLSLFYIAPIAEAGMMVHDANGQYLGLGTIGQPDIYIPSLDVYIEIQVIEDSDANFRGNVSSPGLFSGMLFESTNCSGVPYNDDRRPVNYYGKKIITFTDRSGYWVLDYGNRKLFIAKSTTYGTSCTTPLPSSYYVYISSNQGSPQSTTPIHYTPVVRFQGTFPFTLPVALPLRYTPVNFMDVNGDGKTGLAEAIYSLQKTAGAR